MRSFVRTRLTYANVVATLALFAALGGSAYAAAKISSKQVKNRSLRGIDVKRNTLTGTEIRESKLGTVRRATSATNAQHAGDAVNAQHAGDAANANLAATAANAQLLAGQDSAFFEKSSRTQVARATPAAAPGPVLLSWPEFGVEISAPQQTCGTPSRLDLFFRSTRTSGPSLRVYGGDPLEIPPGTGGVDCSADPGRWIGVVTSDGNDDRALFFDCFLTGADIRCVATRSEP